MLHIWYPARFKFLKKLRYQVVISISVIIINYSLDLGEVFLSKFVLTPHYLISSLDSNSTTNKSSSLDNFNQTASYYTDTCEWVPDSIVFTMVYLAAAAIVPFVLMLVFNINSIRIIHNSRSRLKKNLNVSSPMSTMTSTSIGATDNGNGANLYYYENFRMIFI